MKTKNVWEEILLGGLGACGASEEIRHETIKYWSPLKSIKSYSYTWIEPTIWDDYSGKMIKVGTIKVNYFKNKSGEHQI